MRTTRKSKGLTNIVMTVIVSFLFLAVVIPIALQVWQSVDTVANASSVSSWTYAGNQSLIQTSQNIGAAFTLYAILPIVIAAAAIITVLLVAFRFGGGT